MNWSKFSGRPPRYSRIWLLALQEKRLKGLDVCITWEKYFVGSLWQPSVTIKEGYPEDGARLFRVLLDGRMRGNGCKAK